MNVKEFKELIKDLPDLMDVFMVKDDGEFSHQLVNSAEVKTIRFFDDTGEEAWEEILELNDEY